MVRDDDDSAERQHGRDEMSSALDLLSSAAAAIHSEQHVQQEDVVMAPAATEGDETEEDEQLVVRAQQTKPSVIPHEVPEDSGVIRCPCELEDDDGFTIQCEWCNVWQHATCVEIEPDNVPEVYLCDLCDPQGAQQRGVDPAKAKHQQTRRLQQELPATNDPPGVPTTTGTNVEQPAAIPTAAPAKKRRGPGRPSVNTQVSSTNTTGGGKRSTPASTPSLSATLPPVSSLPVLPPVSASTTPATLLPPPAVTPSVFADQQQYDADPLLDGEDRIESWQYEFTPVSKDLYRHSNTVDRLVALLDYADAERITSNLETLKKEQSQRVKVNNSNRSLFNLLYDPTPVIFKTPPETLPIAVKPIANNSVTFAPPNASLYVPTSTSQAAFCPYPRPLAYGLHAAMPIATGDFIAPVLGQVTDIEQYRRDPVNQYTELGVPKPSVRTVPYPYSVAIDQRMFGNETRFVRSGCHPNAIVRPYRVLSESNNGDADADDSDWADQRRASKLNLSFGLFALSEIGKRDEIVIPWDFDDSHLVHALPTLTSNDALPPLPPSASLSELLQVLALKMANVSTTMLGLTQCACDKKRDCAIFWLTKAGHVALPTSSVARAKQAREPFANVFLSAMQNGGANENGPTGTGASAGSSSNSNAKPPSRRRGAGSGSNKKPDLGLFVGLSRGWLVESPPPAVMPQSQELEPVKANVETASASQNLPEQSTASEVEAPIAVEVAQPAHVGGSEQVDVDSDATEPLSDLSDDDDGGDSVKTSPAATSRGNKAVLKKRKGGKVPLSTKKSTKEVGPKRKAVVERVKRKKGRESTVESDRPLAKRVKTAEKPVSEGEEEDAPVTSTATPAAASTSISAPASSKKKDAPTVKRNKVVVVKKRAVDAGSKDPVKRAAPPTAPTVVKNVKSLSPAPETEPPAVATSAPAQSALSLELFGGDASDLSSAEQAQSVPSQEPAPRVSVSVESPTPMAETPMPMQVDEKVLAEEEPAPSPDKQPADPEPEAPAAEPVKTEAEVPPPEPEAPKAPPRARLSLAAYRQRQAQRPNEASPAETPSTESVRTLSSTQPPEGADASVPTSASEPPPMRVTYPSLDATSSSSRPSTAPQQPQGSELATSTKNVPSAEDLLKSLGDYFSGASATRRSSGEQGSSSAPLGQQQPAPPSQPTRPSLEEQQRPMNEFADRRPSFPPAAPSYEPPRGSPEQPRNFPLYPSGPRSPEQTRYGPGPTGPSPPFPTRPLPHSGPAHHSQSNWGPPPSVPTRTWGQPQRPDLPTSPAAMRTHPPPSPFGHPQQQQPSQAGGSSSNSTTGSGTNNLPTGPAGYASTPSSGRPHFGTPNAGRGQPPTFPSGPGQHHQQQGGPYGQGQGQGGQYYDSPRLDAGRGRGGPPGFRGGRGQRGGYNPNWRGRGR